MLISRNYEIGTIEEDQDSCVSVCVIFGYVGLIRSEISYKSTQTKWWQDAETNNTIKSF